jgi:hypothetical protein
MALIHAGSGFFCAVGEEFAAPGLAVEQLTQEAGDFALAGARIEQPSAYPRWRRGEPGSVAALTSFRHVGWVWVKSTFFNSS